MVEIIQIMKLSGIAIKWQRSISFSSQCLRSAKYKSLTLIHKSTNLEKIQPQSLISPMWTVSNNYQQKMVWVKLLDSLEDSLKKDSGQRWPNVSKRKRDLTSWLKNLKDSYKNLLRATCYKISLKNHTQSKSGSPSFKFWDQFSITAITCKVLVRFCHLFLEFHTEKVKNKLNLLKRKSRLMTKESKKN